MRAALWISLQQLSKDRKASLIRAQTMALLFTSCKASSGSFTLSAFSLLVGGVLMDGSYLVEEPWLSVLGLAYQKFTMSEPRLVIKAHTISSPPWFGQFDITISWHNIANHRLSLLELRQCPALLREQL